MLKDGTKYFMFKKEKEKKKKKRKKKGKREKEKRKEKGKEKERSWDETSSGALRNGLYWQAQRVGQWLGRAWREEGVHPGHGGLPSSIFLKTNTMMAKSCSKICRVTQGRETPLTAVTPPRVSPSCSITGV